MSKKPNANPITQAAIHILTDENEKALDFLEIALKEEIVDFRQQTAIRFSILSAQTKDSLKY